MPFIVHGLYKPMKILFPGPTFSPQLRIRTAAMRSKLRQRVKVASTSTATPWKPWAGAHGPMGVPP